MDDGLKTRDIEYLNTETWLLLPPHQYFWLRACPRMTSCTCSQWRIHTRRLGAVK